MKIVSKADRILVYPFVKEGATPELLSVDNIIVRSGWVRFDFPRSIAFDPIATRTLAQALLRAAELAENGLKTD